MSLAAMVDYLQKTREGCGRFWGLFGGSWGKLPGKMLEKITRVAKGYQFWDFRHRERQTCREPWVDTAWTWPPPSVRGVFWNRQFQPSRAVLTSQDQQVQGSASLGAKKSTQTFFVQSFSKTLRVMDVRAENRGRLHQKVRFSAAPVMGWNFSTQGRPGVRVRNVRGKSGPKSLCLCCFLFPESCNSIQIFPQSLTTLLRCNQKGGGKSMTDLCGQLSMSGS